MGSGFSTLASVTNKLTDLAYELALKHLIYIAKVSENVQSLSTQMDDLQSLQDDIVNRITREERDGTRKETKVVQRWRSKVDKLKAQVNEIKDDYAKRGCRIVSCGCGSSTTEGGGGGATTEGGGGGSYCSFNCWSNYWTGKAASKKIVKVKELLVEGRELGDVTEEQLPPPAQMVNTEPLVLGVESNLDKAMRYLKDECDHGILGIWGTGGVGKSTLLAEINNSLAAKVNTDAALGDFQHVIHVVASHGCTPEKIQKKILEELHLPSENYVNDGKRASAIANYLMNKNFVLLLDDLWKPLDLVQIGIPRPPRHCRHHAGQEDDNNSKEKRWKVILVSRCRDVCSQMGANNEDDTIHVAGLKGEDAWRLFEEKVGPAASDPSIRDIAEKIVEECGGLPLALVTIGHALSSKRTRQAWQAALKTLQKSRQISGTEEKLFTRLKLSYDYLEDDRMRECYLCCSLWPEDYKIVKENLIECWLGHGLINNFDDVNEAFNIGHSIIESLEETSLLEATEDARHVKMHDVLRDMALWIACDCGASKSKWIVRAGLTEAPEEERLWTEATKISLMHTKIEELPSTITTSCPNVTTLMLSSTHVGKGLNRLHYFHNLKYLDLSSCFELKGFPMEICGMVNLEYLNLSNNTTPSIPEDVIHLQNLKYLILENTGVSFVPAKMISNLLQLLVLQLYSPYKRKCNHDSIIDQLADGVIRAMQLKGLGINVSSVSSFQKLSRSGAPIYNLCLQKMETEASLSLLSPKLLGMPNIRHHLKVLDICFCSEDLEELLIQGDKSLEFVKSLDLNELPGLKRIIVKEVACKALFPTLTHIRFRSCDGLKHVTWILHLPCLTVLRIELCKNMKKVIEEKVAATGDEEEEETRPSPFAKLESIKLIGLPSLTCICSSTFAFPSLRRLDVYGCPELKKLPFKSGNCTKIVEINGWKRWWEGLDWEEPNDEMLSNFRLQLDR